MRAIIYAALLVGLVGAALAEPVGVVKTVEGTVQVRRDGVVQALAIGDDLYARDIVRTSVESAFAAALSDGSRVSLGEESELAVEQVEFEPAQGVFSLFLKVLSGRFVYSSGRIGEQAPENVRIETPYMTIGTRGTRLALVVPENGAAGGETAAP